jgi:hypothetical protein
MKKILSKAESERKNRRNQIVIGIILIGLMTLSTAGYAITSNSDNKDSKPVEYNGVTFTRSSDYWSFNSNGYDFLTKYNPEETKDIQISNKILLEDYKNKPLYFATLSGVPDIEIARNLNERIALRIQSACISENNCTQDLPLKDCSLDNIIVIKEPLTNQSEMIYQDEKCIFIRANELNQTKYADAFLFNLLGI